MKSTKYTLTKHDLIKIAKGAGIAALGALAVYFAAVIQAIDWSTVGKYGILLAPLMSVIANALIKFASETPTSKE